MITLLAPLLLASALAAVAASAVDPAAQARSAFPEGNAAFNAHDLPRFMRTVDADMHLHSPTGWLRSAAAIRASYAAVFARFPAIRTEVADVNACVVAPGVVAIDWRWRVMPAGTGPAFEGTASAIYVRKPQGWRAVLEHETTTRTDPALRPPGR